MILICYLLKYSIDVHSPQKKWPHNQNRHKSFLPVDSVTVLHCWRALIVTKFVCCGLWSIFKERPPTSWINTIMPHQCSTLSISRLTHFHFHVLVEQERISLKMPKYLVLALCLVPVHSGELFDYLSFSFSLWDPGGTAQYVAMIRITLPRAS